MRRAAQNDELFAQHAAPEAVAAELKKARTEARRWQRRANWLAELLERRTTELAAGDWPPSHANPNCEETPMTDTIPAPAYTLPHRTSPQLLDAARQGVAEARQTRSPGLRYAAAHLAALRAASAVLVALRRVPAGRVSVWTALASVVPEYTEWAGVFAAAGSKRAAAEAGIPRVVDDAEADSMVASAETFVDLVADLLGAGAAR